MGDHSDIDHTGITGLPDLAGHIADAGDAHDASAISIVDAGSKITATDVEGALQEVAHGAWTDFTPTIGSSGTPPTLGSSTLTGRYKLLDSKTLVFQMAFTVTTGGAWAAGTGSWTFALPGGVTSAAYRQTCAIHVFDNGGDRYVGTGVVGSGGTTVGASAVWSASTGGPLGATTPVTWATGDYVLLTGTIEIA